MSDLAWPLLVAYVGASTLAGHLLHELTHVAVARLTGCQHITVDWPHVRYDAGPLQALVVSVAPLVVGGVGLAAYGLLGQHYVAVGTFVVPHPVWFGLVALSMTGKDDLGVAYRVGRGAWQTWRMARMLR